MKKVIITGGSLNGNSGAEAMLVTAIKRIQEKNPDTEFGIFTPYYKDDMLIWNSKAYNNKIHLIDTSPIKLVFVIFPLSIIAGFFKLIKFNFTKSLFPKAIKFLWDSNVFIDVAGVSFIDSRIKFLPFNILSIYPAFLLKVPVVKYAQATGPYKKIVNQISAKHCLSRCNHIFARGTQTLKHLQELKIPSSKYTLSTDVAFCNKIGDSLTKENINLPTLFSEIKDNNKENKKVLGLCPSSVVDDISKKQGLDYLGFLVNLSSKLLKGGYYLVLFPNATKEHKPDLRRNNDIPIINELVESLAKNGHQKNFSSYTTNLNTDGVKTLIKNIDFSIVSRFHAMIFALSLKKPVFVLGWSHKYLEIMEQFGLEKYVVDYMATDVNDIIKKVDEIGNNIEAVSSKISEKIEDVKSTAYQQIDFTNKLIS